MNNCPIFLFYISPFFRGEVTSLFRVNESYIPYIGYVYDRMHIGFSYDIVNPYLINYSNINRSLELSVGFQLSDKSSIRKAIPWY